MCERRRGKIWTAGGGRNNSMRRQTPKAVPSTLSPLNPGHLSPAALADENTGQCCDEDDDDETAEDKVESKEENDDDDTDEKEAGVEEEEGGGAAIGSIKGPKNVRRESSPVAAVRRLLLPFRAGFKGSSATPPAARRPSLLRSLLTLMASASISLRRLPLLLPLPPPFVLSRAG